MRIAQRFNAGASVICIERVPEGTKGVSPMHSFAIILVHCVWSTKRHEPLLNSQLRNRLWPYLGGIARENKAKALAVGGTVDHVHVYLTPVHNFGRQNCATSQRKFIQMDSRNL